MNEAQRRRNAMRAAAARGADALLLTHVPDVRYLSGFTGSNGAVAIFGRRAVFFTDGRYTTQAKAEVRGMKVVIAQKSAAAMAVAWLTEQGAVHCAIDSEQLTLTAFDALRTAVPGTLRRNFFLRTPGLTASLRQVKDADEIARLRRAAALGCALFEHVLGYVSPNISEAELAAQLEFQARMAGAEAMSFETIVAGGVRSALPHGRASSAKLPKRGFVTMDFGVLLDGYCSDMTRTIHLGKASRREFDVYHSVLEAQKAAVAAVIAKVTCGDVDEAARSRLEHDELGKYFTHSTGHGVGLEIHEGPRIASKQAQVLKSGMVVTIEPGVYIPDEFGVRIEDMVLVTPTGHDVLTAASPKTWIEIA